MHKDQIRDPPLRRKPAQPRQALLAEQLQRRRGVLAKDQRQQGAELGGEPFLSCLLLRAPENLVGVADNTGPAQLAHPVDDLGRLGTHQSQIAAVQDSVDRPPLEVRHHRLQGSQVSVDIRDNRQSQTWLPPSSPQL